MTDLPSPHPAYPLGLLLGGRRVVVVGGGSVATRRTPALLDAGADVLLVAPEASPALQGLAQSGRLRWLARRFEPADLDGAWLVHVAVDDPAAAAEVSAEAERRRVFCVRADDRTRASAWTPAVTRHGPVTVAVLGGRSRRAMAVRDGIRDWLAERAFTDAPLAGGAGPAVKRAGGAAGTGGAVVPGAEGAVVPGAEGAVVPGAEGAVVPGAEGAAEDAHAAAHRAGVALVGAGPGDPELITVKGRRLLAEADVVVVDRLAPGLLLDELRPEVEVVDASKIPYGPQRTQQEINHILVERARAGRFVVRLKGGDPFVFGRGGEELLACVEAGIPVTVVPGVTSAVAVPAAAGIPVTHRGVAHEFVVVSGHLAPDDPGSLVDWAALARLRGTVCVLMGLTHLGAIVAALLAGGRPADTPAAAISSGTTGHQRVVRAPLAGLPAAAADLRPPAVVVVGAVVGALPHS